MFTLDDCLSDSFTDITDFFYGSYDSRVDEIEFRVEGLYRGSLIR